MPGFWQVRLHPLKQHFSLPSQCASLVHSSTGFHLHRTPIRRRGTGHFPGLAAEIHNSPPSSPYITKQEIIAKIIVVGCSNLSHILQQAGFLLPLTYLTLKFCSRKLSSRHVDGRRFITLGVRLRVQH